MRNRIAERARPARVIPRSVRCADRWASFSPLEFVQVRRTPEEALFNSLLEQHHYLGYEQPVGEHLKYLVKARGQVIACLAWQSAPRHLKVRDRYLGMERGSAPAQRALAGLQHALSDSAVGAGPAPGLAHSGAHGEDRSADWQRLYAHPIYWLETFVDTSRFRGHVLSRGQLAGDRHDCGTRASRADVGANTSGEADVGFATSSQVSGRFSSDEAPASGRESGRAGPDHRSRHRTRR